MDLDLSTPEWLDDFIDSMDNSLTYGNIGFKCVRTIVEEDINLPDDYYMSNAGIVSRHSYEISNDIVEIDVYSSYQEFANAVMKCLQRKHQTPKLSKKRTDKVARKEFKRCSFKKQIKILYKMDYRADQFVHIINEYGFGIVKTIRRNRDIIYY